MLPECAKTELVPAEETCKCGVRNIVCQPLQICHWVYDTCFEPKASGPMHTLSILSLMATMMIFS
jgi:hypothetical protein